MRDDVKYLTQFKGGTAESFDSVTVKRLWSKNLVAFLERNLEWIDANLVNFNDEPQCDFFVQGEHIVIESIECKYRKNSIEFSD